MKELGAPNETVSKILESAVALFNLHGYAGTSISDIAKQAQLSKGLLYHYFKDKDELYLYCAQMCIEEYMGYLEEHLQNPIDTPDAITTNVKVRVEFFEAYPQYRALFDFILSKKPEHLASELTAIRQTLIQHNVQRLKTLAVGMEFGKGVSEEDLIAFIAILQNNAAHLMQAHSDTEEKLAMVEAVVRLTKIFLNGVRADIE